MKIVHICLAMPAFIVGSGYQESVLTQIHSEMGHLVTVLAGGYIFNKDCGQNVPIRKEDYRTKEGVKIRVLPVSRRYGVLSKCNDYDGVFEALSQLEPDVIFVHGGQSITLKDVIRYRKRHKNVRLYIDQHGDYNIMPLDTAKRRFIQKWIYGHWIRKAVPYVETFWGVTPWRCQYLHQVYGVPEKKIDLLVMGGKDEDIHLENKAEIRRRIREQYGLSEQDFVVITGGKLERAKQIPLVMKAVAKANRENLKLLVFGRADEEMQAEIEALSGDSHIIRTGWLEAEAVYDYYLAADLAVFPGAHSVLWEQSQACGLPGIFKEWEGMHHVNVNGSALFLKENSSEEIQTLLLELLEHREKYDKMKEAAERYGTRKFSYREIAKRAIGL